MVFSIKEVLGHVSIRWDVTRKGSIIDTYLKPCSHHPGCLDYLSAAQMLQMSSLELRLISRLRRKNSLTTYVLNLHFQSSAWAGHPWQSKCLLQQLEPSVRSIR
jgi:hypothetical protein